jgi:hypothetical protein
LEVPPGTEPAYGLRQRRISLLGIPFLLYASDHILRIALVPETKPRGAVITRQNPTFDKFPDDKKRLLPHLFVFEELEILPHS